MQSEAFAHIAGKPHIEPCALEDVIGEHCGSGLAVATGDAHHLGCGIASGKFDFGNHRDIFRDDFLHDRCLFGDSGAFHNLICHENATLGVPTLFPRHIIFVEHFDVMWGNCAHIAEPYIATLEFSKNSGTHSAFSAS